MSVDARVIAAVITAVGAIVAALIRRRSGQSFAPQPTTQRRARRHFSELRDSIVDFLVLYHFPIVLALAFVSLLCVAAYYKAQFSETETGLAGTWISTENPNHSIEFVKGGGLILHEGQRTQTLSYHQVGFEGATLKIGNRSFDVRHTTDHDLVLVPNALYTTPKPASDDAPLFPVIGKFTRTTSQAMQTTSH